MNQNTNDFKTKYHYMDLPKDKENKFGKLKLITINLFR